VHVGYWWESQKEKDHWEEQGVGVWTILKWILEGQDGMIWIEFIWLRVGTSGGSCEHGNKTWGSIKRETE
jgi:hypothetical protein